CAQAIALPYSF
nr:immunoglobulin light chain junction region [Macaca mulatta]